MSLVKMKDKRTGVTYVYESESYWDKEKKQPRNRRKLIGKLDEQTGEIVPTAGKGRPRKQHADHAQESPDREKQEAEACALRSRLEEKDARIRELEEENRKLSASRQKLAEGLKKLLAQYGQEES